MPVRDKLVRSIPGTNSGLTAGIKAGWGAFCGQWGVGDVAQAGRVTSHWLLAVTHAFDEPIDDNFSLTAIEVESQVGLITLVGNGLGLAVQGGVEQPLQRAQEEEPFSYHFGPIVELSQNKFLLTLNPLFFKETGDLAACMTRPQTE